MDDVTPAPERWLPIPDWGDLYEASDEGRIRRIVGRGMHGYYPRITIRKPRVGKQGYYLVQLWRDCKPTTMMVHRLVA